MILNIKKKQLSNTNCRNYLQINSFHLMVTGNLSVKIMVDYSMAVYFKQYLMLSGPFWCHI